MKENLELIKNTIKPKNKLWKVLAKVGIFVISLVLKNQKGVDPNDINKGVEIANKTIE